MRPGVRRRKRRLIGALRPAKARRAWIIRKRSRAKRSLRARVTLHNPSEIPDNYVIFINGEKASKADVLRLAPRKIKRMEVLRGKEAAKEYTAPAARA